MTRPDEPEPQRLPVAVVERIPIWMPSSRSGGLETAIIVGQSHILEDGALPRHYARVPGRCGSRSWSYKALARHLGTE